MVRYILSGLKFTCNRWQAHATKFPALAPDDLKVSRTARSVAPLVTSLIGDNLLPQKIVAVAFLTRRDLDAVGSCLERVFPVQECGSFDAIVATLDALPTSDSAPEPNHA
jgi:hypothetical protein